jgi:hypothetical protein
MYFAALQQLPKAKRGLQIFVKKLVVLAYLFKLFLKCLRENFTNMRKIGKIAFGRKRSAVQREHVHKRSRSDRCEERKHSTHDSDQLLARSDLENNFEKKNVKKF